MARVRRIDDYIKRLGDSVRSGSIDIDSLIKRLVEEAVSQALERQRGTSVLESSEVAIEDVVLRLEQIEHRLAQIEERLEKREAERGAIFSRSFMEEFAKTIAAALATVIREYCASSREKKAEQQSDPRWLRMLKEKIKDAGFVLADELPAEVRSQLDISTLESRGYIVRSVSGTLLIVDPQALKEFTSALSKLRDVSDEFEAETRLGRFARLFRVLRSEGYIYYAGPSKGWRLALDIGG
jgi:hypothetical protein